ncbi:HNH endonuclease signature motif containing protein [Nocardioides zeae]|uniref:HNH endonuclease signature motif containing protein n=1 Tax=Nocardioides imazamoxiresistens TaxID=3231893 RepID=A0ABU3PSP3_9ACTN|nr:HNH endonuclease signature motif containing protein [Nocardioides zeae]MDT9591810.1 HNH endonuclease signature motif containing protein [Nocardioides zeae]
MSTVIALTDRAPAPGGLRGELPGDLLDGVRAARAAADAAEVRVLELALEWAYAHPVLPGCGHPGASHPLTGAAAYAEPAPRADADDVEAGGWYGLPEVAWDAPAGFAAANRTSTAAGAKVLRDALQLAHRLPLTWARTRAGDVPAWRARRVADAVAGQPDDVAAYVDLHVHACAGTVGPRTLARMIDEALLRLHAEDRELDQLAELDRRHATLHLETLNHTGLVEMTLRGDYTDLAALDDALTEIAHALADPDLADLVGLAGCAPDEKQEVRRALAAGVLAHPHAAAALLDAHRTGATTGARPAPSKRAVVHLHLSEAGFLGLDPVARLTAGARSSAGDGRGGADLPVLLEQVRAWLMRDDTHVTVRPVIDTTATLGSDRYEIPDRLRSHVLATRTTCIFPWCERPASSCDLDHLENWGDPDDDPPDGPPAGRTSTDNLGPECRHHHRLKTHGGWRVRRISAGHHLWADPTGHLYATTPTGTVDLG